jgi:hypothetical protein
MRSHQPFSKSDNGLCERFTFAKVIKTQSLKILSGLQAQVARKVEAFERFFNLNAIALGLLQVLALELPNIVWAHFPRWFRTLPKHGLPSEQIVRIALQHQQPLILSKSRHALLLPKLLAARIKPPDIPPNIHSAA